MVKFLHLLFSFKGGDRVAIFAPPPPFSGVIPPNVLGIGQSYFVHPQAVLQISIPFQRSYIGQPCHIQEAAEKVAQIYGSDNMTMNITPLEFNCDLFYSVQFILLFGQFELM